MFPFIPIIMAAVSAASKRKAANAAGGGPDSASVTPMSGKSDMSDMEKLLNRLAMNKQDPMNAIGMAGQGAISGRNVLMPANSKKRRNMMAAGSAAGNIGQNVLGALSVMSKMGMFDGGGGGGGSSVPGIGNQDVSPLFSGDTGLGGLPTEPTTSIPAGLESTGSTGGMPWDELFGGWGGS